MQHPATWRGRFDECRAAFEQFWSDRCVPQEARYFAEVKRQRAEGQRWAAVPVIEELRREAMAAGLFNLFLPAESGLSQREYAVLAATMGRAPWFTQVFNCDAPDTGNMETLHLFGTPAQQQRWLGPMLRGEIRSAIVMTEPEVASSDATNIATTARREGDQYVINGRKWYITGFGHPDCKLLIVFARTGDGTGKPHQQHSMFLVPRDAAGVEGLRPMEVFGEDDAPLGHWELELRDVRVPADALLVGEGRGFAIAQGRLGPGRVHHSMRAIGMAERALDLMLDRAVSRVAFKQPLARHGVVQEQIAESRMDIEQARHLVLHCAHMLDTVGIKHKRTVQAVGMIKVVAPRVACRVIDRAMQVYGAMGLSQDTVLPMLYAGQRSLRVADGPDDVHIMTVGKLEIWHHVKDPNTGGTGPTKLPAKL